MESSRKASTRAKPISILRSLEEKYVVAMKKLQFGEFNLFTDGIKNSWTVVRYISIYGVYVKVFHLSGMLYVHDSRAEIAFFSDLRCSKNK